jgi:aerobic carbon-monoxide dehydrogenase medium subunit
MRKRLDEADDDVGFVRHREGRMKSAPFSYHRPTTLAEALEVKRALGDQARVLAGGQSLMPMMHFRLATPAHLIDINGLDDLAYVRRQNGHLAIGARTRHAELLGDQQATAAAPLLTQAVALVGHAQIRHRGTVVGSLAHADPSAEIPAAVLALGGEVTASRSSGTRTVAAADLLTGPFTVSLADDEIITELRVPAWPDGTGTAFLELTRIYHGFPVVGVAAAVHLEEGVVDRAAVGLCGMAANAITIDVAALVGNPLSDATIDAVAQVAVDRLEPPADVHGSTAYRKRVGRAYVRRALIEAGRVAGADLAGAQR